MNLAEVAVGGRALAAAVLATIGLLLAVNPAGARAPGDALFDGLYRSTAVLKDGEPHPLFDGTQVSLEFERRDDHDAMRWRANCNFFGADVQIRPRRLLVGRILGTAMGCDESRERQDDWLVRFFSRDPRWERVGRKLKLRSQGDVIRFRRV